MKKILIGANVLFNGKQYKIKEVFGSGTHITLDKCDNSYINSALVDLLPNNLIIDLLKMERKNTYSHESTLQYEQKIAGDTYIEIFETFYKMNNQLRYCNGSYFSFKDDELTMQYKLWLKSDDYNKKSFNLFYGGGVVD